MSFVMRKRLFLLCLTVFMACGCTLEDELPALVTDLMSFHSDLTAKTSCADKLDHAENYVAQHADKLRKARTNFDKSCPVGHEDGIRCRSYFILAETRIERALNACRDQDNASRIDAIFDQLSETTGAYFEPVR